MSKADNASGVNIPNGHPSSPTAKIYNQIEKSEAHNFCNEDISTKMNGYVDSVSGGNLKSKPPKVSKQKVTFQKADNENRLNLKENLSNTTNISGHQTIDNIVKHDGKVHTNKMHTVEQIIADKCASDIQSSIIHYHQLKRIPQTDQICELQTVIRDKETSRCDFIFYADRLIRLIIEEGLNQLPYSKCTVTTPTGLPYEGLKYMKGNCGVSIIRSGEAMEKGLRECCRSIRIGKILIRSDVETHEARVLYAKFPCDVSQRKVLLMYPILGTGNTVSMAVNVLKDHGVLEENIILLTLFCSPEGVNTVMYNYPKMTVLTSEVHDVIPFHFGEKYFGTGIFDE